MLVDDMRFKAGSDGLLEASVGDWRMLDCHGGCVASRDAHDLLSDNVSPLHVQVVPHSFVPLSLVGGGRERKSPRAVQSGSPLQDKATEELVGLLPPPKCNGPALSDVLAHRETGEGRAIFLTGT